MIFTIKPYIKYKEVTEDSIHEGDYRNSEPWAEYTLYLPGVGLMSIPYSSFGGDGSEEATLNITYVASPCTGDISYIVAKGPREGIEGAFLTVNGNFGVDIPMGSAGANFKGIISSGTTAIASSAMATVGALTGNVGMFAGGMTGVLGSSTGMILNAASTVTQVSGGIGGFSSNDDMLQSATTITRNYDISDYPSNCRDTIGLPLFASRRIGSLSGLVKCTGAYVKTWATEEEHQMIAQFVNSSTNFIFGGLIVE